MIIVCSWRRQFKAKKRLKKKAQKKRQRLMAKKQTGNSIVQFIMQYNLYLLPILYSAAGDERHDGSGWTDNG